MIQIPSNCCQYHTQNIKGLTIPASLMLRAHQVFNEYWLDRKTSQACGRMGEARLEVWHELFLIVVLICNE